MSITSSEVLELRKDLFSIPRPAACETHTRPLCDLRIASDKHTADACVSMPGTCRCDVLPIFGLLKTLQLEQPVQTEVCVKTKKI
jgi:hypothetical protein